MQKDSAVKTLVVAGILCVVCSVIVSTAAIMLKPMQVANKKLDIKKNLLISAGLLTAGSSSKETILEKFKVIETKLIDLSTGLEVKGVNPDDYDTTKAAKKAGENYKISTENDVARIRMRAKYSKAYFIKEGGVISKIVLPVYGKGLWSTMYGFIVLSANTSLIQGIGFYSHGETPGLGGEIENPSWQKIWVGKKPFDENFNPIFKVIKGSVHSGTAKAESKVDGLAGATMTSNGVTGMVQYWLGKDGFGLYLEKLRMSL